ncbi:MAG: MotA/TolQ/ExbB proton channel family protein, partial [Planctomycetota bacterium]
PIADADRAALRERISTLDESRKYLPGLSFEAAASTARTMVEAYPLLGVLGTILAIGASLQGDDGAGGGVSVGVIVGRFGEAIWSTFAGLAAAILLMFIASLLEARFTRLVELRKDVRFAVARAKRELALSAAAAPEQEENVQPPRSRNGRGARRPALGAGV